MQVPDKFPQGCEFFSTVREMRNYVRFPDKSIYMLSFKGADLIATNSLPACPVAPLTESAFVSTAWRCRQFAERLN